MERTLSGLCVSWCVGLGIWGDVDLGTGHLLVACSAPSTGTVRVYSAPAAPLRIRVAELLRAVGAAVVSARVAARPRMVDSCMLKSE